MVPGANSQGKSFLFGPAMREADEVTGRLCHRSCTLRGNSFGPDAADLRRIPHGKCKNSIANPPVRHKLEICAQEQMRASYRVAKDGLDTSERDRSVQGQPRS